MRTVPDEIAQVITEPKEIGARVTFRKTLPVFSRYALTDSLGLTDPAWIDACNYGAGILRITSAANVLYTQYIPDVHAAWPAWTNTGIALYAGSRPAVDNGYVWYQIPGGQVYYRYYATWGTAQSIRNMPGALALAPLSNRCYALWQRSAGSYEIVSLNGGESSQYAIYGPTSLPRVDVVSYDGKEYFYTMDRDAGRVIEIQHVGNAVNGQDSYGVGKSVIPIDAIDDVYGFKLGYASAIDGRVVVTGRLTRTSDDTAVSFDAYATGPENFSFGREMFIQGDYTVNGKMLRVGNEFIVTGASAYWLAQATTVFGGAGDPDLEITTSDLSSFTLTEAESRSSNLGVELSTELSHAAITPGSDVVVEMAYENNWVKLATCNLEDLLNTNDCDGQRRTVSGVGKSARRLASWSPDQGVYIPSMASTFDFATNLGKFIRTAGTWEAASEDADSTLQLKDLNKIGVLYAASRASRGGSTRAQFFYPADTYFKPYYGVAINYYRETAADAAVRLGVDVDTLAEDQYGHNGIVAIYSGTEHGGGSGISLNLWSNSVLTKLTSVSLAIPADTRHWLQIEFIEGEIRVRYRLEASTAWTDCITFMYNQATLPWKRETLGRGAVVVKNIVPTQPFYGLGSADLTLAVDNNTLLPSSGTLLIGNEQISYNGVSTSVYPNVGGAPGNGLVHVLYPPLSKVVSTGWTGHFLPIDGALDGNIANHSFAGLAFILTASTARFDAINVSIPNKTFRVTDYAQQYPQYNVHLWSGEYTKPGWTRLVGTGTGSWSMTGHGLFLDEDVSRYAVAGEEPVMPQAGFPFYSIYGGAFKKAYYLTERGANDTVATEHAAGTAHLFRGMSVQVGYAAYFTQDEDQTIEDALKTIVGLAGGKVACRAVVDESHSFPVAGVVPITNDHKNFVVSFELPANNSAYSLGVAFRSASAISFSNGMPVSDDGGYYLGVENLSSAKWVSLYKMSNGSPAVEMMRIRQYNTNGAAWSNTPLGTVKISVQDNLFSVWLNGRYLYTFHDDTYPEGTNIGLVSRWAGTYRFHLSDLDDLLADIVVGTRGNGMSVLSELLADRHIMWRDEPDGSMFFYKARKHVGDIPDIISAVSGSETDAIVSRLRAEGVTISEVCDQEFLRTRGNMFVTVNARYANSTAEAGAEARRLIDENWRNSKPKKYSMVPHPALQPGDAGNFLDTAGGIRSSMIINSQVLSVGFSGNNLQADMECNVIPFERE